MKHMKTIAEKVVAEKAAKKTTRKKAVAKPKVKYEPTKEDQAKKAMKEKAKQAQQKMNGKPATKEATKEPTTKEVKFKSVIPKKGYCRDFSYIDVIRHAQAKGLTKQEVIEKADTLYVKNGGSSNLHQASVLFGYIMKNLVYANIVIEKQGKFYIA